MLLENLEEKYDMLTKTDKIVFVDGLWELADQEFCCEPDEKENIIQSLYSTFRKSASDDFCSSIGKLEELAEKYRQHIISLVKKPGDTADDWFDYPKLFVKSDDVRVELIRVIDRYVETAELTGNNLNLNSSSYDTNSSLVNLASFIYIKTLYDLVHKIEDDFTISFAEYDPDIAGQLVD